MADDAYGRSCTYTILVLALYIGISVRHACMPCDEVGLHVPRKFPVLCVCAHAHSHAHYIPA